MITKKSWNALSKRTRQHAIEIIFAGHNMPVDYLEEMAEEWHHDNDAPHSFIFSHITVNKDKLKITREIDIK